MARVLVIDDDSAIRDALARGLAGDGFSVELAADGPTGLRRAFAATADVVVLDVMLPRMSGYEVLRRMRAAQVWSPVLMLTAKDGEYDVADSLDLGADDFLAKPFSFVVLLARVRALNRRGRRERPTLLSVGDLVLDPAARRCTRAGTEVALTAREFAVLEALMTRPGEVLSKADILRQVWYQHYEGPENIVEVYVSYLRRKLDAPFGRRSFTTVRGVGYRLDRDDGLTPSVTAPRR